MTPRFGFLKRTALGFALTAGLSAACAIEPVDPAQLRIQDQFAGEIPEIRSVTRSPIEESLARLEALEVLDVTDIVTTRTEHAWIPYGGFWSDNTVEMGDEEVAERLENFVTVAEAAAASVDEISEDANGLCWAIGDGSHCLTIADHADDLAALNDLEIVDVAGVVRDNQQVDGVCYSSWETVSEDVCRRALKAQAIVEATAEFPNRRTPEGDPDQP